ncbi:hypothetical protein CAC42_6911 [Sphaceloma murrayae]|uniref:Uncharacterized protein n=1 Tax=Sphaceloma murrayae TaxID=2082308 RepID=A0A2K1QQ51_9PEZI|nr:hypothetical protein CAC42_6911 [Sphaceloma murrayae]
MENAPSGRDFVVPSPPTLATARSQIHTRLPTTPLSHDEALVHLDALTAGLSSSSTSPHYYGFVTGGTTPIALAADHLVSRHDQNVSVHLPTQSVATDVEDAALRMLIELLDLGSGWEHRTFTTGATASNVLGLACGREAVVKWAGTGREGESVAALGLVEAMRRAGVEEVKILTCDEHSSLRKASSVVGLGHGAVIDVGRDGAGIDLQKLRRELETPGRRCIVSVSCAEVNTGLFATRGKEEMEAVRRAADEFGAWVHVDAAFGLMARVLPAGNEFEEVKKGVEGMELADSIAGDAHKLFNVPYDCGFFLSKHLAIGTDVFQNPGAPYLATSVASIPSPLNIGLENSRRFRAFPVYANMVSLGREGYADMLKRQIRLSRMIAKYMLESEAYELLPVMSGSCPARLASIYIIVLFRAREDALNEDLIHRINDQRRIFCSGTKWKGKSAVRFAISNWQVDVERDWLVVRDVLDSAIGK